METDPRLPLLYGATLQQLDGLAAGLGLPGYAAGQLADWLYKKNSSDFMSMSNLSREVRVMLAGHYRLGYQAPQAVSESEDGTRKYLFPVDGGFAVESALIPDRDRATLCLSTQIGCRMGCCFCMTARQGRQGDLAAGEILNQYRALPERDAVTNLVYMGMGEPLDNPQAVLDSLAILTAEYGYAISPTRITVSTIGVLPALITLVEQTRVHLALSLHSPFEDERASLIPASRAWPLAEILGVLEARRFHGQRRLTLEYLLFRGLNDGKRHAEALGRIARRLDCRVNLLAWHVLPEAGPPHLVGAERAGLESFQSMLVAAGVQATIRRSRGEDIGAACGLLSTQRNAAAGPSPVLETESCPVIDCGQGAVP
jgi:23S rRNA (adenine2503-C2)-methyltransferase